MARSATETRSKSSRDLADRDDWTRTVSLVIIAVVLVLGASSWMSWLIVPLIFALVLAVALHPIADRLERLGLNRGIASVLCMLLVAVTLLGTAVLVTAQAGQLVGNSDRYIERLSGMAAESAGPFRENELVQAVVNASDEDDEAGASDASEADEDGDAAEDGIEPAIPVMPPEPSPIPIDQDEADAQNALTDQTEGEGEGQDDETAEDLGSESYWQQRITENADTIGEWVVRGVGGAIGLIAQAVVLIFLVLYILHSRATWTERIEQAANALGVDLHRDHMDEMGQSIARWTWSILGLSAGYAVIIGVTSGVLGLPHWPLWGVLTGVLMLVPFFGPLIAVLMLVTVAAIGTEGWGPPLIILASFLLLQLVEWLLVHPRLYGRTVHFDALTVLIGVLLFGFLWGPLGFVAALPVLVLIRGLVEVTPGSEAVTALFGEEE